MPKPKPLPATRAGAELPTAPELLKKEGPALGPVLRGLAIALGGRDASDRPGDSLRSVEQLDRTLPIAALRHVVDVILALMLELVGIFLPRVALVFEVARPAQVAR